MLKRYLTWWNHGKGRSAQDLSHTTRAVFERLLFLRSISKVEWTIAEIEAVAEAWNEEATAKARSTGAGALLRVCPLAMCWEIGDDQLAPTAKQESRLTHASALSQSACAAFVWMLRKLIYFDASWSEIVQKTAEQFRSESELLAAALKEGLKDGLSGTEPAKVCAQTAAEPEALEALRLAVYFVSAAGRPGASGTKPATTAAADSQDENLFERALQGALVFSATAKTIVPALVGALAGARWGYDRIARARIASLPSTLLDRCVRAARMLHLHTEGATVVHYTHVLNRCKGMLAGLVLTTGLEGSSSLELLLCMAEQLCINCGYDPLDTFRAYVAWWDCGKGRAAHDAPLSLRNVLGAHAAHAAESAHSLGGLERLKRSMCWPRRP